MAYTAEDAAAIAAHGAAQALHAAGMTPRQMLICVQVDAASAADDDTALVPLGRTEDDMSAERVIETLHTHLRIACRNAGVTMQTFVNEPKSR